ncbi:MAG: hypothetical protein JWL73_3351 [Actinomycetia bacterium]|nr:hypothetical protein [Actinomycetes bacterium]
MAGTAPLQVSEILVPLDGSDFANTAIPTAVRLALKLGAGICLFSAVASVDAIPDREILLATFRIPELRVDREVVVDLDPAGAIHETLRRRPGTVVCMATHARARAAALARSVLAELLARGQDPAIAVGPAIGDFAPWVEDERPGRGVVVGVDDAPEAIALAQRARQWAALVHEPLTVVTVAEPVPPEISSGPVHRKYGPDDDVEEWLRLLVFRLRRDNDRDNDREEDVRIETRALYDPVSPTRGLLEYVREHPPTLVVAGTHPPTGLKRLARGSKAAAIVRGSGAPVLVVPVGVKRPRRQTAGIRTPAQTTSR